MKVIAFLSQKGGSGKTTLAVHTAVAAVEAHQRVVLLDTDPQGSATHWRNVRKNGFDPPVTPVRPFDLERVVNGGGSTDLVIIDSAPHAAVEAARVARIANLVLIPCRPTALDLAAMGATVNMIRATRVRAAFVLSACPSRAPEIAEVRNALAIFGVPVAPGEVTERRAYSRAIATGRAVTEFEPHGRAAEEIRALWAWVQGSLAT